MAIKHTITSHDKWFLDKHIEDPVTHELFKVGDCITICANCKTAQCESTWDLKKCCSICEHNNKLQFNTFSSAIFQPKKVHNSRFNIVTEKLSFLQRLKLFNGYPITNAITVVLPIIFIAIMLILGQNKDIMVFNITNQFTVTQSKVMNLSERSLAKLNNITKKPVNIDIKFKDLNNRFVETPTNLKSTRIGEKLKDSLAGVNLTINNASAKISRMFERIQDFMNRLFSN